MTDRYIGRILTARVYDIAEETALDFAANLSRRIANNVWLKREDQQQIFSFKLRGAYNKMALLRPRQRDRGVVAASAGNHAQGVALAARQLGCHAAIVMPITTPQIKVDAVRALGADVELVGDSYDEANGYASDLCRRQQRTLVPPYDDVDVIAGNGTIGFEILKQHKGPLDAIFVPVGGGGLIAGIAAYIRQIQPAIRIIGVEPEDADAMHRSRLAGRRVRLRKVGIFADGVAVRQVGKETFRLVQRYVDEIILVSTDEICAAIKDVFEDTRSIMEPSGALAVAGLKKFAELRNAKNSEFAAITSGANMNFDRLRHVSERAEIGERREAIIAVTIPEKPGSFRRFCSIIGKRSITEFNYRYADPNHAHIFVGLQIQDSAEIDKLTQRLRRRGYATVDFTDNEMAKVHVRHMVGGRASLAENERIYRFEFPERPAALLNFLQNMGETWNISMFHYRNHGNDFGRVLCGIQVPNGEQRAFRRFLRNLGYPFSEETHNPAYKLFLA
ncbi:MAG: threonine ammonia-lyase, biosynthetic [Gammaproteobacteria bacterium]|nr:threonine ammonia-lyase, biosynthetic [Gammaproteobacteria bacterium]MDH3467699.1 threonine ammonia-lyase, biosynthetic [Gammaproteobacteria bacterium]